MRPRQLLYLVILGTVVTACASAPVRRTIERQVLLPGVTFDKSWNAVIDMFGERSWTIANMEKASGFINSDWMNADQTAYVDCGSPGITTEGQRQGRFNVVVREATGGIGVTVNTAWRTTREFGGAATQIECTSTGVLEGEIFTQLKQRVGVTSQ
jgi:hypothetical protein